MLRNSSPAANLDSTVVPAKRSSRKCRAKKTFLLIFFMLLSPFPYSLTFHALGSCVDAGVNTADIFSCHFHNKKNNAPIIRIKAIAELQTSGITLSVRMLYSNHDFTLTMPNPSHIGRCCPKFFVGASSAVSGLFPVL